MEVFHGTHWKSDEGPFTQLDPGFSDYGAVWFTNVGSDAEYFAQQYSVPGPGDTPVVLKGEIELEDPYTWGGEQEIEIPAEPGEEPYEFDVDFDDREHLFDMIMRMGHDAFVVPQNYPNGGDDIAVLRQRTFYVTGVKILLPNQPWSDWMPLADAEDAWAQMQEALV